MQGMSIPNSEIYHAAIFQKVIKGIMNVVHIKLSIATTVQFQIFPRCQESKKKSS